MKSCSQTGHECGLDCVALVPKDAAPPHCQRNFQNSTRWPEPEGLWCCRAEVWSRDIAKISERDDAGVNVVAERFQNTPRCRPYPISTGSIDSWSVPKVRGDSICKPPELFMLEPFWQMTWI